MGVGKECGGRGSGTSLFSERAEARRDLPVGPAPPYCEGTCRSCGSARCNQRLKVTGEGD